MTSWKRCAEGTAKAGNGSVAGAFCGSGSSRSSVRQKQRSGSVEGAFCGSGSSRNSILERDRSQSSDRSRVYRVAGAGTVTGVGFTGVSGARTVTGVGFTGLQGPEQ